MPVSVKQKKQIESMVVPFSTPTSLVIVAVGPSQLIVEQAALLETVFNHVLGR